MSQRSGVQPHLHPRCRHSPLLSGSVRSVCPLSCPAAVPPPSLSCLTTAPRRVAALRHGSAASAPALLQSPVAPSKSTQRPRNTPDTIRAVNSAPHYPPTRHVLLTPSRLLPRSSHRDLRWRP